MNILEPPLKIVHYPHPSLRHEAKALTHIDDEIRRLAYAMLDLMYNHNGLGLAAPQVGVPFRLFVANYAGDPAQKEAEGVYINPQIIEKRGTIEGEEGCLSFPQLYQKVRRAKSVTVQAYTLDGKLIEVQASDLPARIWQHEIDHLDGILFIDKLGPIGKISARAALKKFEQLYLRAQEKGEILSDEEIRKRLDELDGLA